MNNSVLKILTLSIVIIATMSCRQKATSVKSTGLKDSVTIAPPPKIYLWATVDKYRDSISHIVLHQNEIGRINRFKTEYYGRVIDFSYLGKINSKVGVLKFIYSKNCLEDYGCSCSGFDIYDEKDELIGGYGFGYEIYNLRINANTLYIDVPECKEFNCDMFKDSIPNCLTMEDTLNNEGCYIINSFRPVYREDIKRYGTFKDCW